ncbi:MAG: DUF2520 domain-containing protein [Candidatus Aminicenantes bacterium]|jgi:predicted short-subunit dehydrogenase-like oxidoreductase (DUF2520 family)
MNEISIIGAGRLGTSLGVALSKKGYRIKFLSCRTSLSAEESRKIIGEGKASTDNIQAARAGDIVILCLPDEEIVKVAKELDDARIRWSAKFIFHCSGLLSSEVLQPLKAKGALTASIHPVQSFAHKRTPPEQFENIYFGLEGESKALEESQKIIQMLGGRSFTIKAEHKALYHTACSIASNFFVVLLDTASSLLNQVGLQEEQAFQVLLPLVKGTLHNVKKFDIHASLTGPVIRGDKASVEKHLEALRKFPPLYEMYRRLAFQALEITSREKKLSVQKIKALKDLLEEK